MTQALDVSLSDVSAFLIHEADLLDEQQFDEWHALFAERGTYTVPLSGGDPQRHGLLVNDDPLRLEERVHHISEIPFPSQSPKSRTLHVVGNTRFSGRAADVDTGARAETISVTSNQVIFEMRLGDFRQVGLGEQRVFGAKVEHELEIADPFLIVSKRIWLVNRGAPMSNLTFLL